MTVRPAASTLLVAGEARRIDYKAMQVLLCLARSPGQTVEKRELFAEVWADSAVSDDVLTGAVSTLRRTLGDGPKAPRYIQTIPRVGYRLLATPRGGARPGNRTGLSGRTSRKGLLCSLKEGRMRFTWDETKRQATLRHRGLDFAKAPQVFDRGTFTWEEPRFDYDERRFITLGSVDGEVVVLVHTETEDHVRVISMRKAEKHEQELFFRNGGL